MENNIAIILLSGGIDSTTLLAKLRNDGYDVIALSFDYGQKNKIELNFAKQNATKYNVKYHHIINLDKKLFESSALVNTDLNIDTFAINKLPKGQVNAYVPYRNLLFLSTALSLAETIEIKEIFIAVNRDDSQNFWDCNEDFIKKLNAISPAPNSIQIRTPFIDSTKKEIIELAQLLNVDLKNTITCYQPNELNECGVCLSCLTKLKALN